MMHIFDWQEWGLGFSFTAFRKSVIRLLFSLQFQHFQSDREWWLSPSIWTCLWIGCGWFHCLGQSFWVGSSGISLELEMSRRTLLCFLILHFLNLHASEVQIWQNGHGLFALLLTIQLRLRRGRYHCLCMAGHQFAKHYLLLFLSGCRAILSYWQVELFWSGKEQNSSLSQVSFACNNSIAACMMYRNSKGAMLLPCYTPIL